MNRINTFEKLFDCDILEMYNVDNVEAYKYIKDLYKNEGEDKLKEYIFSEHVLSVVYKIKDCKPFEMSDVQAVLSGIGELFLPHKSIYFFDSISEKERLIIKTYWYFKTYSSKVSNLELIKIYLDDNNKNFIKSLRLFKFENNKIIPNIKNIDKNEVYKKYIEISSSPMPLESFDTSKHYKDKKDGILDKYIYNSIEESVSKEGCGIKKYEEINSVLNSTDILEVAERMDDLIVKNTSKKSSHYRETIEKINILKYDGKSVLCTGKNLLELQGIYTHLAGKTGAGKSVELDMILKILSENGKRILVITPNHASSFKIKKTCEDLDIPNVMLMGRNREEYMDVFFEGLYIEETQKNKLNTGREINHSKSLSFLQRNDKYFRDMSGGCSNLLVKRYFEDKKGMEYTEDKYYYKPCASCQEIKECSFTRPYRDAFSDKVNVIITPIQTLTKSKLMGGLDVERRTLLESLILTADLVITDEVDEIQSLIESVYAYKDIIYSNDSQINSSKIEGSVEYYKNELSKLSRKSIAESYPTLNRKLNDFDTLINFIGKYFLSDKTIGLVEKEIKFSTSFDEDSLVYDYFKKYYYKSKKDKEVLKDKANKFSIILKSDKSKKFLDEMVGVLLDKYTKNEEDFLEYMITDTEDKAITSRFNTVYDTYYKVFEDEMINYNIPQINNQGKKNKANNKEMIKHLMFIFLIVKLKEDYNSLVREAELKIDISRKKNSATSMLPSLAKNLLDSTICGFVIDKEDIQVEKSNGSIEIQKAGRLKIFKYEGIGREVLLNTNKYLSVLYGTQVVPMLMCSATSGDTKSSLHTIKYPVNLILQNTDQLKEVEKLKDYLKLYCHVFEYDGKVCTTSGNYANRLKDTQNICKAMKHFILERIEERRASNEGVLLVSPSAEISYEIYDALKQMFPEMNIKVLYTSSHEKEFNVTMHIDRNAVEQCASKNVDILIAVNQTIARGFNILKNVDGETNKSYFTDIIMFNRFLPSPEDYLTHISFAHIMLEKVLKDKNLKIDDLGAKYLETVREANKNLKKMKHIEGFSQLPVELKEMIIGNIYCLLSQIKGRGQRGGSSCRIHLIDANCYPETAQLIHKKQLSQFTLASSKFRGLSENEEDYDDKDSMMQGIIDILNKGDELSNLLFDEMKEAFNNHIFISH